MTTTRAWDVEMILERLDRAEVEVWVDGGWGVDALVGEQTREHHDLDLIVRVDDVPAMREVLAAATFELVSGGPDSNFVLRDTAGREIDVHPVRFDEAGDGHYQMEDGNDWVFPASGFTGIGRVGQRTVQCLTPDVQMLCHATGYVPDDNDLHDMRLLNARFGTLLLAPFDEPAP